MVKFGTRGELVTCDMWLKEMPSTDELCGVIEVALMDAKINVVNFYEHEFEVQGATLVWVLSESHCIVHSYPEHKYISIDMYTCGEEGSATTCMDYIQLSLKVADSKIKSYPRGVN